MKDESAKVSILVVDDRPDKLMAMEAMLDEMGERIVLAQSGKEALRRLLHEDFAVVLLDVNMPGMDGFETAQLIRQRKRSRLTPIIFLTAFGDTVGAEKGYALGAVDYMLTPVVPEVLRAKVNVFAELFRKTEQVRKQAESLERRAAQMHALNWASISIHAAQSLEAMLDAIAVGARGALGARAAFAALPGSRGGKARYALARTDGREDPRRSREIDFESRGDWIFDLVRAPGAVIRIPGPEHVGRPQRPTAPLPDEEVMAAPLVSADGRAIGWIEAAGASQTSFTADDEQVLILLSRLASVALQNLLFAEEREVNRLKDEFLATLSHELRTPLTAILGWTRILRDTPGDPAKLSRGLEVIERNVGAQSKLIEDLLDVSRIVTDKMRIERKRLHFAPLVEAVVDALRPAAQNKDITLTVMLDGTADVLSGDPDRLRQVVTNLLNNAIKFTPKGGRVDVRLRRTGHELELVVADNGEGIHQDFLPFVFERFRQGDSSSKRSHGGLGIGLALVRHIISLHAGTVIAQSEGPRRGATFIVRLPGEAVVVDFAGPTPPPVGIGISSAAMDLGGLRVLVVEDDADTREILHRILSDHRADVRVASSVREALSLFDATRPDVLVSDISMSGEDGYDFIRQVRRLSPEQGGAIPALALTAHARAEDQARVLAAGFQRHASKPIEPAELVRAVAGLVHDLTRRQMVTASAAGSECPP
ncbi:hybrid sensor histidine kinase/response regulator [Polyangium aurulentum]|uniref:hybrid sensor histidine kinase/response regulator n=1 Tax=Polyangium aurulentum TaxID=2567896 RepID=UPI0010ADB745|nr:response regulator [Polyangium aurulentum]UQA57720.1 response regulator [Polyangium aurulentum]